MSRQYYVEPLPPFHIADGPAAGTNGYIDSPGELAAVAELMLNGV